MRVIRPSRVRILVVVVAASAAPQPIAGPPEFFQLLRTRIGMSEHDLAVPLLKGRAVARRLPAHDKGEVAVVGAESIAVPLEFFLNAFQEMPVFKRGQQILQVHQFSNPPLPQDLKSLTIQPADIQALSTCAPGHCRVKLSAAMMEQLRSHAAGPSLESFFRDVILRYLTQYLEKGNPAMITYADKLPAIHSVDLFRGLLQECDWLSEAAAPLYHCLDSFSGGSCPQIASFDYWSSAKFGLQPVFSITQVLIYKTVRAGHPWVFIAFKQVYADHYIDASLGLAVVVEQSANPRNPELWILYLNRSLTDALGGWLHPLKTTVVDHRSRAAVQRNLMDLKDNLEQKYLLSVQPGLTR